MAKQKYEVVDYKAGGFFIHGGNLVKNYFESKDEADFVCAALNMVETLKMKRTNLRIRDALIALEDLKAALDSQE